MNISGYDKVFFYCCIVSLQNIQASHCIEMIELILKHITFITNALHYVSF